MGIVMSEIQLTHVEKYNKYRSTVVLITSENPWKV